jgi:uncharacterized membrane protein
MEFKAFVFILGTLFTGLMAGLFYSWSFSVVLGLRHLGDREYIRAMQSMNRAILNPAFFIIFFGSLICLPVTTYLYRADNQFELILIATIIYLAGVFGVTALGNIPLNRSLEAFTVDSSSDEDAKGRRFGFEGRWNRLNLVRTITSVVAFILLIVAWIQMS